MQVWQLELIEGEEEGDEFTGVLVSDLVLYLDHEDPGLRGQAAKLVCKVSLFFYYCLVQAFLFLFSFL